MKYVTPDLCDQFPEVNVLDPIFNNYGGRESFGGEVVTVKCFEDNSVVKSLVDEPGKGKVMVVDGGGHFAPRFGRHVGREGCQKWMGRNNRLRMYP